MLKVCFTRHHENSSSCVYVCIIRRLCEQTNPGCYFLNQVNPNAMLDLAALSRPYISGTEVLLLSEEVC